MEDRQIVDLYWARSEDAISETANKYGKYFKSIAYNILHNAEDCDECVNDTYFNAWRAMPDKRPDALAAFLGRITRNLALNRWESYSAEKRGAGQTPLVLEELHECVPGANATERTVDDLMLAEVFNRFLESLPVKTRRIFVRRYWYLSSVREIAADFGLGESNVKMTLLRARKKLKSLLEKEGISL